MSKASESFKAVNNILARSNSNIRIFDVKPSICQTICLHRFGRVKSAVLSSNIRIFDRFGHLKNRCLGTTQKDKKQQSNVYNRNGDRFKIIITTLDHLFLFNPDWKISNTRRKSVHARVDAERRMMIWAGCNFQFWLANQNANKYIFGWKSRIWLATTNSEDIYA